MRSKLAGDIPLLPEDVVVGEEDEYGIGLHMHFDMGKTTPKEIWESKDVWFANVKTSQEFWENMSDDQREALINLVTGALERMHDRVDDWVPEGLIITGGEFLDINLRILFTDIDKAIDRNEQATSFQVDAAASQVEQWIAEADDED